MRPAFPSRLSFRGGKDFFPFIDKYGQFIHKDWPDKIHSDADFAVPGKDRTGWFAELPARDDPVFGAF